VRLAELASKKKLSELRKKVPVYPIIREAIRYDPKFKAIIIKKVENEMKAIECEELLTLDGFRVQFEDGWALVRPSGTEPKIRYLAEARTEKRAKDIMDMISKIVKRCLH